MASATAFRFSRNWQRRISGALSAVLCLWLLAFATHFHTPDQDQDSQHTRIATHLCGYCGSLASAGATPHVGGLAGPVAPDTEALIPPNTQAPSSPLIISHRSRAPPVA